MNEKDIEFIKQLQHEMLTQDTVCQADPRFWVVQGTVKEYGCESGYADGHVIALDFESSIDDMKSAFEWLGEHDRKTSYTFCEENESIMCHTDEGEYLTELEEVKEYIEEYEIGNVCDGEYPFISYYKNVDRNYPNTMFLTNRECKEHIKRNYYHYPDDAHSYAMTAWRSPQVERLYKIIQQTNWDNPDLLKNEVQP